MAWETVKNKRAITNGPLFGRWESNPESCCLPLILVEKTQKLAAVEDVPDGVVEKRRCPEFLFEPRELLPASVCPAHYVRFVAWLNGSMRGELVVTGYWCIGRIRQLRFSDRGRMDKKASRRSQPSERRESNPRSYPKPSILTAACRAHVRLSPLWVLACLASVERKLNFSGVPRKKAQDSAVEALRLVYIITEKEKIASYLIERWESNPDFLP
ncbi:hypothetical protein B0H16DRAFT_1457260 [Mycena metata]|uniref:Uncharacterized protein n=1 Tax=Mycena metata TaxID=1033252 RepID=A0AAD7NGC8_9AGAR|nr:hypothetical protein B0H16DRAFT_1457260 [Mycena metata]